MPRPFQIYFCPNFPDLKTGEKCEVSDEKQIFGQAETLKTTVEMVTRDYEEGYHLLRIKSLLPVDLVGYIKVFDETSKTFKPHAFSEYLESVDFSAYLHSTEKFCLFQAPKRICSGVFKNLERNSSGIKLEAKRVDFSKISEHVEEFKSVWFKDISANVRAENLTGPNVQNDGRFKELMKVADISNITIPFTFKDAEHRVMISQRGAVILSRDYHNTKFDLELITKVKSALLDKLWEAENS